MYVYGSVNRFVVICMYVCMYGTLPVNDCTDENTQEDERHQDDVDYPIWK